MMIKAPYLLKKDIWEKTHNFKLTYPRANTVPVNIEEIVALDMGIEIIPEPNLKASCDIDAYITRDFKSIVVDRNQYMDDKFYPRVRFSIAHEIGHLVLHKEFFERNNIGNSTDNWFEFMRNIPEREYTFLEMHANEFAGVLLVPADELISSLKTYGQFHDIARHFQVSADVIKRRIVNDDVAPNLPI
jgi:Zn-dependent peptidase ImmA (M78 family)